jgi:mono/diheme cytochrome c family protein
LTLVLAAMLLPLSTVTAAGAVKLPQGPHRDLVYGKCRTCHDLQYLQSSKGITKAQWKGILDVMTGYGLEVSDQQRKQLLGYLSTYLGPNPPKQDTQTASKNSQAAVSGKAVFNSQCVSCHQSDGQGQVGEFPPLAGNEDLFRTRKFPVFVLLNGLQGKITVNSHSYDGQMPSFDFLSNDKIAAVVNYVRTQWGNDDNRPKDMKAIAADDVASARNKQLSAKEVHAYRANHP